MTMSRARTKIFVCGLQLCAIAFSFAPCDARRTTELLRGHSTKNIVTSKHLDLYYNAQEDDVASNTESYGVGSPFTILPYDALPPISWPDQNTPPLCIDSPTMPLPPPAVSAGSGGGGYTPLPPPSSSSNPTPTLPFPNPPLGSSGPITGSSPSNPSNPGTGSTPSQPNPTPNSNPPLVFPSPPILTPSPSDPILSPPYNYQPSPPTIVIIPRPPTSIFVPSPPVFQPPVVYPPPAVPPPPRAVHNGALWCVAKPTVPDPIIQEAMNYACGSGGDCGSIQPEGLCFQPDTLYAHSSYAFNSYWQRTKVAGGTCDFGGTAMLVTVDPSYDGCHFVFF